MPEYAINIARHGFHWAKYFIGNGSFNNAQAIEHFDDVCKRYPSEEGFTLELTKWQKVGEPLKNYPTRLPDYI